MIDTDLIGRINAMAMYRTDYEPRWYSCIQAYENNHFVGWSRQRGTLLKTPFRKRFFLQLPETKKQADSFENLLLMSNPMFVIAPNDFSNKEDLKNARAQSQLLRQKYLDWDADNIIHQWVHNAIVMPISYFEINLEDKWDPDRQKMVTQIVPRVGDAVDWLFDPHFSFEENQMVVKILRKPHRYFKDSALYKLPTGGMQKAMIRDFKEIWMTDKYGERREADDYEVVTAYECHIKSKKDGVSGLTIRTVDMGGWVIRDDFYENIEFFPVIPLQLFSGPAYQPSHVENLLPINRSLDLIANRIEDYLMKFVKGGWLKQDGSQVSFTDENGSITSYTGMKPDFISPGDLPQSVLVFWEKLLTMSERYGVNLLAMGGMSNKSNQRSGKQGDQAVKGAMAQQKTPVDNLFYSMKRIAEVTLYFLSELTDEPTKETLNTAENQGGEDFKTHTFVGEKYHDLYPEAVPIPQRVKKMHVEMENSQTYTLEEKRKDMMTLAENWEKIADPFKKPILDLYRIGNTDGIMAEDGTDETLLDNPEMKSLLAHKEFLPPEVKQSLSTLFAFLAQQSKGSAMKGDGPSVKPPEGAPPGGAPPGQPPPGQAPPGQPPPQGGAQPPPPPPPPQ